MLSWSTGDWCQPRPYTIRCDKCKGPIKWEGPIDIRRLHFCTSCEDPSSINNDRDPGDEQPKDPPAP